MIHGRVDIGIYGWKVYLYIFENPADVAIHRKNLYNFMENMRKYCIFAVDTVGNCFTGNKKI